MKLPITEIAIADASLGLDLRFTSPGSHSGRIVWVGDVVDRLRATATDGPRVVLLTVDSLGGQAAAWVVLFDALRSFSESGGTSIAYVRCLACSSAALYVLGADYVVADPMSGFAIHGGSGSDSGDPLSAAYDELAAAVLVARTLSHPDDVRRWLGPPRPVRPTDPGGAIIPTKLAAELGFVDFVGDEAVARLLAHQSSAGSLMDSQRRKALRHRPKPPPHVDETIRAVRLFGSELSRHPLMHRTAAGAAEPAA